MSIYLILALAFIPWATVMALVSRLDAGDVWNMLVDMIMATGALIGAALVYLIWSL